MIFNSIKISIKVFVLFLFFTPKFFCQERVIHQPDSIYKVNRIKSIKFYNGDLLLATVICDKEGRWVQYIGEPISSGWQKTEYFEYDLNGKLIKQYERIKDRSLSIFNTKIEYSKDELKKLTKYNPDGSINEVLHFENMGRKKTREIYNNGLIFHQTITEYLDDFYAKKIDGWYIKPNSEKVEWTETFDYEFKNGQVKKYTIFSNGNENLTVDFTYNKKGLIEKVIYNNTVENYKYQRY